MPIDSTRPSVFSCEEGGVILRPGSGAKVGCGNAGDAGGDCYGGWPARQDCPSTAKHSADVGDDVGDGMGDGMGGDDGDGSGQFCWGPWRPQDAGVYLQRGMRQGKFERYNEFLLHGAWWHAHLPVAVEAFIAGTNSHPP